MSAVGRGAAPPWRRWLIAGIALALVSLGLVAGLRLFGLSSAAAAKSALALARGPWALPAVIAAFAVLAFLGAPQFALIAATVAVYGPWLGSLYAWIATLVSALAGFSLGRATWGEAARSGNGRLARLIGLIGRRGFAFSLVVRLAPAGPFVLVNMAAGAAPMRLAAFVAGTAIGIAPKIALTATAGRLVSGAIAGDPALPIALTTGAVVVWLAAGAAARLWLRGREAGITRKPRHNR